MQTQFTVPAYNEQIFFRQWFGEFLILLLRHCACAIKYSPSGDNCLIMCSPLQLARPQKMCSKAEMEACVSPASPSAFCEYSVSLHDRSSNSSPWGCFASWIILGHCSSRGNLLVPIKRFPSLLKEKSVQNTWWKWSAHPRADGKSSLCTCQACFRWARAPTHLIQMKGSLSELNDEPIIWIRCVDAGKHLKTCLTWTPGPGIEKRWIRMRILLRNSRNVSFESVCFFIHLHVTSYFAAVIIIDDDTKQQTEIWVVINCF